LPNTQLWVHKEYRRKGIATKLLDTARSHMVYGHTVPRSHVVRRKCDIVLFTAFAGTNRTLQMFLVFLLFEFQAFTQPTDDGLHFNQGYRGLGTALLIYDDEDPGQAGGRQQ